MRIEPLFARVILERPVETQTKGGVLIPENSAKRNLLPKGVVKDVGNTCEDYIRDLIGKEVYFAKFAGDWIKLDDKTEVYICQEEDILGVVHHD